VTAARIARAITALVTGALLATGCALPGATKGPIELTAVFDDVGDLVVNHSVQTADVRIGSVTKIELTDDFKAKITMSIKDVGLPKDSEAIVRQTSLLGEKFIEIRPLTDDESAPKLEDGDAIDIDHTSEAPELEFVAQEAVSALASVTSSQLATLVETGAVGFGGRGEELRGILDDLTLISSTLADQTTNILSIIDGFDRLTATLADSNGDLDQLLVNLAQTTTVLAQNRDQAIDTLAELGRLAGDQNRLVFEPYLAEVDQQVKQLDAILGRVAAGRAEVALLIDWLDQFVHKLPLGVPKDFAQIYGWFDVQPLGLVGG